MSWGKQMLGGIFGIFGLLWLMFVCVSNAHATTWDNFINGDPDGVHRAYNVMFQDKTAPKSSFPIGSIVDIGTTKFIDCVFCNKYFNNKYSVITDASFEKSFFSKLDFSNALINNSNFVDGTNLMDAKFIGSKIYECNFQDVICRGANFSNAIIKGSSFHNVGLVNSLFRGAYICNTVITPREPSKNELKDTPNPAEADFSNAMFDVVRFESSPNHRVRLPNANFSNATICDVDFSGPEERPKWGADLRNAKFNGAIFRNVNFYGTKLDGTQFNGAQIAPNSSIIWVDRKIYVAGEEPWINRIDFKTNPPTVTGANLTYNVERGPWLFKDASPTSMKLYWALGSTGIIKIKFTGNSKNFICAVFAIAKADTDVFLNGKPYIRGGWEVPIYDYERGPYLLKFPKSKLSRGENIVEFGSWILSGDIYFDSVFFTK